MVHVSQATLNLVASNEEAVAAVRALADAVLPGVRPGQASIPSFIYSVDAVLTDHHAALLAALAANNPTVESVRAALAADVARTQPSVPAGGQYPLVGTPSDLAQPPPDSARAQALRSSVFKELETLASTLDLESQAGLFEFLAKACDGKQILPLRILFNQSTAGDPLAKIDSTLGALNDKRSHLDAYADHVLTTDVRTGNQDPQLRQYTVIRTPLMVEFKRQAFAKMYWVPSPALLGWQQHKDAKAQAVSLPESDHYCIPQVMRDLGPYGQKLFTGLYGFSSIVDVRDGFSWDGLCKHVAEHLDLARRLDTRDEQLKWLSYTVEKWLLILELISDSVKELIFSSDVANLCTATYDRPPYDGLPGANVTVNRPLLRADASPLRDLADRRAALEVRIQRLREHDVFGHGPSSSSSTYDDVQLPRLSSKKRPLQVDTSQQGLGKGRGLGRGRGRGGRGSEGRAAGKGEGKGHAVSTEMVDLAGSKTKSWRYKKGKDGLVFLVISGRVWNVTALAKHLRVAIHSICWPYVLARAKSAAARPLRCDKWGQPGHGAHGVGAHISIDVDNPTLAQFWTKATPADTAGLESIVPQAVSSMPSTNSASKGKGKGKGRGRGRGRGGRGGDPYATDDVFLPLTWDGEYEEDGGYEHEWSEDYYEEAWPDDMSGGSDLLALEAGKGWPARE